MCFDVLYRWAFMLKTEYQISGVIHKPQSVTLDINLGYFCFALIKILTSFHDSCSWGDSALSRRG